MSFRRDRIETLGDSPSERSPGLDNRALGALSSTNGKEKTTHSTTNGKEESRPQLDQRKKENRSQHYQRKRENHSQLDQRKNRLVEPVSGACEGNRVETPVTMPGHWDPQTTPRSKDQP